MSNKAYIDQLMQEAVTAKMNGDVATYEYIMGQLKEAGCFKNLGNNKNHSSNIKVKTKKRY